MWAGTQNALGHTVASLIIRPRRYASLGLTKVLLTRPTRSPPGLSNLTENHLPNRVIGGAARVWVRRDISEADACVSAEAERERRGHGVADAVPGEPIPLPPRLRISRFC